MKCKIQCDNCDNCEGECKHNYLLEHDRLVSKLSNELLESVGGWYGVDFDGTLAKKTDDLSLGEPVDNMIRKVKEWLSQGKEVRIVTARVSSIADDAESQRDMIEIWCKNFVGQVLPVTAEKDMFMIELWDDRVVQVVPDAGKSI